jgi:hypothetical protein
VEPVVARQMWRTLEPVHGMIYFAPEAATAYKDAGLHDPAAGYFASRSAPMGAVTAEVVMATFFNFNPDLVRRAIPAAWAETTPERLVAARLQVADTALTRVLGDDVVRAPEMAEAAELARVAAQRCRPEGRPLAAGHLSLAWPDPPHLALWHAIAILREYRGDGHIAALTAEGVAGCEALVLHAATGEVGRGVLQSTRGWSDDEWAGAVEGLQARGWIDRDESFTAAGRVHREWVEDRTDAMALAPWTALAEDGCRRLRHLVRPWSQAIVADGALMPSR